jgi:hypothetical protein
LHLLHHLRFAFFLSLLALRSKPAVVNASTYRKRRRRLTHLRRERRRGPLTAACTEQQAGAANKQPRRCSGQQQQQQRQRASLHPPNRLPQRSSTHPRLRVTIYLPPRESKKQQQVHPTCWGLGRALNRRIVGAIDDLWL